MGLRRFFTLSPCARKLFWLELFIWHYQTAGSSHPADVGVETNTDLDIKRCVIKRLCPCITVVFYMWFGGGNGSSIPNSG